jgi:1-acyl-sn-glycerol-3-phosphate acyltransferase
MLFALSEPLVIALVLLAAVGVLLPLSWTIAGMWRYRVTVLQGFLLGLNLLLNRLRWHTQANRPMPLSAGQGAVIVANHRSGFDPMFLQIAAPRLVHWMVAKEYCKGFLGWFFRILRSIPAGRGGIDTAAVKHAIRLAENGELVGMMPEGRINESNELMLPGRPGAALVALRARVPIIPCYISGAPYNGRTIGPLFMRANVEVIVGDPIDLSEFYDREREPGVTADLTKRIMKEIARLGGMEDFEPQLAGRHWKTDEIEEAEEENHATP